MFKQDTTLSPFKLKKIAGVDIQGEGKSGLHLFIQK